MEEGLALKLRFLYHAANSFAVDNPPLSHFYMYGILLSINISIFTQDASQSPLVAP